MPRPRSGLGQGLEALVPPARDHNLIAQLPRMEGELRVVAWEIATLRRKRRRLCHLEIAPGAILDARRRRRIKASPLLALGALGAAGWELTAVADGVFYLKRPLREQPS